MRSRALDSIFLRWGRAHFHYASNSAACVYGASYIKHVSALQIREKQLALVGQEIIYKKDCACSSVSSFF
jgi:hypothetical protein